jgi:hypothetical protein
VTIADTECGQPPLRHLVLRATDRPEPRSVVAVLLWLAALTLLSRARVLERRRSAPDASNASDASPGLEAPATATTFAIRVAAIATMTVGAAPWAMWLAARFHN